MKRNFSLLKNDSGQNICRDVISCIFSLEDFKYRQVHVLCPACLGMHNKHIHVSLNCFLQDAVDRQLVLKF